MKSDCLNNGLNHEGFCICPIQFSGNHCDVSNINYKATFSGLFCLLWLISSIQLAFCIYAEYKSRCNLTSAFRVTTQKLLYGVVVAVSGLRVIFFCLQGIVKERWLKPLDSIYFPLLITGLSLVACYWSEIFFLRDTSLLASRRGQFLSKSTVAFAVFNLILYISVIANFITSGLEFVSPANELNGAFLGSFAILLFLVYVAVLTVGVELFFKVRGAFIFEDVSEMTNRKVMLRSRIAIVFQAFLIFLIVLSALTNATESLWKARVDLITVNIHSIISRLAEFGSILWFVCVLHISSAPQDIWLLNPRCLLESNLCEDLERAPLLGDQKDKNLCVKEVAGCKNPGNKSYNTFSSTNQKSEENMIEKGECWICYDNQRNDAGLFIRPCLCKGGMKLVHHHCLRRWLQYLPDGSNPSCSVCKHKYEIEERRTNMCSALLSSKHSRLFIPGIILMIVLFSLVIVVFRCTSHWTSRTRVLAYTGLILPFMVIVRCVLESCSSFKTSYEFQAFRILNRNTPDSEDTADKQINPPNCHDTVLPTASTYILSQSSSVIGYKQDNSNVT